MESTDSDVREVRDVERKRRMLISLLTGLAALAVALAYTGSVRAQVEGAQQEALAQYGGELVSVCVAAREIRAGERLDEGNVAREEWVASLLPRDAVSAVGDVAGKTAASTIPKNAVICDAYFSAEKTGVEVPAGKVAVSVPSEASRAVGGAIAAGDAVDIYVSKSGVSDRLARAKVLDTSAGEDESGRLDWVTVAVKPSQVAELLSAITTGSITLVLPGESAGSGTGKGSE